MMFFETLEYSLPFFKALASGLRIKILNILSSEEEVNLNALAARLNITNGALTMHIHILENAGLIEIKPVAAKHGIQKICMIKKEKYLIHIGDVFLDNSYNVEIAPGQYMDYDVTPTCGIATAKDIIGVYDAPRYFSDTEHFKAQVIYFTTGFVEYDIPNYVPYNFKIKEIVFSAELGSEAPGFNNDYKSDIYFAINKKHAGVWQSPGDFGGTRGIYNPSWWINSMNQYGTLMEMRINREGTFFDSRRTGDLNISDLEIEPGDRIRLRLSVPDGMPNSRGLTIFGRGFGNHNSGMIIKVSYSDPDS